MIFAAAGVFINDWDKVVQRGYLIFDSILSKLTLKQFFLFTNEKGSLMATRLLYG